MMEKRHAKRDAMLVYYMKNHPDDFPIVGMIILNSFSIFYLLTKIHLSITIA